LKECILKSGFDRIPNVCKKIEEDQEKDVYKLIEKIEEDEDVQNIFHNIK
jgi:transcriptional/translational regulatory protein YebC/TACO1